MGDLIKVELTGSELVHVLNCLRSAIAIGMYYDEGQKEAVINVIDSKLVPIVKELAASEPQSDDNATDQLSI